MRKGRGKVNEGWEGKKEKERKADGPSHFVIQVYAYDYHQPLSLTLKFFIVHKIICCTSEK